MYIYRLLPHFYSPLHFYEKSRFFLPQDGRPCIYSPILFNSILARRTALRLKEFFFKTRTADKYQQCA